MEKKMEALVKEYSMLETTWKKTGNNIPTDKDAHIVSRKKFLEDVFKEFSIKYKMWKF